MNSAKDIEGMFCLSIIPEGPDVVQRVVTRFLEYRDHPEKYHEIMRAALQYSAADLDKEGK